MKNNFATQCLTAMLSLILFCATKSAAQYDPEDGLMAFYPFNGNATDESANANDGTVFNATLTTDRFGNPNSAYQFNGSTARISAPDHPTLRPVSLSQSAWAYYDEIPANIQSLIGKNYLTGPYQPYTIYYHFSVARATISDAAGSYIVLSGAAPQAGEWFHIMQTFDDDTDMCRLYINGVQVDAVPFGNSINYDASPFNIGCSIYNGSFDFFFNGKLDDVRIYNFALQPDEVAALYEYESSPQDLDDDGFTTDEGDCNDEDSAIYPGAEEICNEVDDNCDDEVDEGCGGCNLTASLPTCRTVYVGYAPAASATLTPTVSGDNGSPTYLWSNGATTSSITVSPASTTTYIVTVTAGANCTATASTLVESVDVRCGNNSNKVLVCHINGNGSANTLCVSQSQAAIHLAHGDALGACGLEVCDPYQSPMNSIGTGPHHHVAEALEADRLLVFPNPAASTITIAMPPSPQATQLEIENSLGIQVLRERMAPETEHHTIDVSKLPHGIYFICTEGKQLVRFVKQ